MNDYIQIEHNQHGVPSTRPCWEGLRSTGWMYGLKAVVGTVTTAAPHSTAWQRFLPEGPLVRVTRFKQPGTLEGDRNLSLNPKP